MRCVPAMCMCLGRAGFLDCFTHAGGAKPRSPELKRNLIAVLIA